MLQKLDCPILSAAFKHTSTKPEGQGERGDKVEE
jgi:hypothetical protein